jgi:hypothetical protein
VQPSDIEISEMSCRAGSGATPAADTQFERRFTLQQLVQNAMIIPVAVDGVVFQN